MIWKMPVAIIMLCVMSSCAALVYVAESPPDPKDEKHLRCFTGKVWVSGHWAWKEDGWVWIPGHCKKKPRAGAQWVSGYWKKSTRGWVWVPGRWQRQSVSDGPF